MIIDKLRNLSGNPAAGDEIPIERGDKTFKIDYDVLAKAIISQVTPDGIGAVSTSNIVNDLTATIANKVLDARQGKALSDRINNLVNDTNIGGYESVAAAAEAIWAGMNGPTIRIGRVTAVSSAYIYIAYVNAANTYGVCLFATYGSPLAQVNKINGTVSTWRYSYTNA